MRFELPTCVVRPFELADAAPVARHANNRAVWLQLRDRFPHPYTVSDAMAFIERAFEEDPPTRFAIEVDGQAAGSIGFVQHEDVERVSAEIGYWLGEAFWGRGVMPQALATVTRYAIDAFELTRVYALPFADNRASCRVLEKAGYVCEGRLRSSAIKNGRIRDQFMYAWVTPTR